MPIYEFVCNACKNPVSVFVRSISSEVNAKCESCGSTDLTRQVSTFAFLGATGAEPDLGALGGDADMASMMGGMGGMGGMGMPGMDDFGGDDW